MSRTGRALAALFIVNAAAVVLIWWSGLEPHALDVLPGRVNASGRLAGLVGTYLVLVQLVLRTHVPWLMTAFGKETLRAAHTWNGYLALGLICVHAALQIVGYALQDRVGLFDELALLLAHYEGMLLAIAGLVLLVALTLVAVDPIRHRVPWPTWRALHLYTYVAVALSVPHQIATGSDFIDAPLAVAYWCTLEAAVLAILLAARLPPVWRAASAAGRPHPAVVGVGALVIGAYVLGSVRLSPAPPRAPLPPLSGAQPAPRPSASPGAVSAIEGEAVETPYGAAQVKVVVSGGRIADVEPVLLPSLTRRSETISSSAELWLRKRAIAAQTAQFDVLSGATYTSRAYMASLDTALRAARKELR